MRKLTLAVSTAALAMSGAAFAQAAPQPVREPQPDVTRAQAQAKAEAAFARMDANKDGTVDQADRTARKAQAFDRIDADKNGTISRTEFDAIQAKRAEGGKDRMGGMKRGGHRAMMGAKMGKASGPLTRQAFVDGALARFDKADANRDGTVTSTERKAARDSMRQQWQAQRAARQQG